ncbi:MAG: hypothetical protein WA890_07155 [Micromonospora sp.]
MAGKLLGKVVAGAALGGASLLVFTPATAYAAGHHDEDEGKVVAQPHAVRPGDHVKLLETCPEAHEDSFVWSKVTGKAALKPVHEQHGDDHGDSTDPDRAGQQEDADQQGRDGKDRQGGEEQGRDQHGRGPAGDHGTPKPPEPQPIDPATASPDAADLATEGGDMSDESDAEQGPDGTMRHQDQDLKDESADPDWKGQDEYGMDEGWEPMRGFVHDGEATVAADAQPGTYKVQGLCGEGELIVLPKGPVNGGDGGMTSTSTDLGMAAGGAGLLGAAALGGIVLMRRRRTNGLG